MSAKYWGMPTYQSQTGIVHNKPVMDNPQKKKGGGIQSTNSQKVLPIMKVTNRELGAIIL